MPQLATYRMAKDLITSDFIEAAFSEAAGAGSVEFKNPYEAPWGDPDKVTVPQMKAWAFLNKYSGRGPKIGMIAAKGASKTHGGAAFAAFQVQRYPGSIGCVISNSYPQAKDNAGPILIKVIESLGYEIEFYTVKKVKGKPMTNFFEITMDRGVKSYILLRSFDAVKLLEGAELDWGWGEEIQDAEKADLVQFLSRVRGQNADKALWLNGMPEDGTHWQYQLLPKMGFIEEANFQGPVKHLLPDGEEVETVGILYEFATTVNKHNVGGQYIQDLINMYDEEGIKKYVLGERTSGGGNRIFYSYADDVHRTGIMSHLSKTYEPHTKIVFVFDFNVFPMSAAVFQPKRWSDGWNDLVVINGKMIDPLSGKEVVPEEMSAPNRTIFAQIDEFEVWPDDPNGGLTSGTMAKIVDKYGDHPTTAVFVGDASGNQRRSSSSFTDWQIIGQAAAAFKEPVVMRGLISNMDLKGGDIAYSNPLNRDAYMNANRLLRDGNGLAHICFLPASPLKSGSGGLAASVASATYKPEGDIENKVDRSMDRSARRTHFADVFKYAAWYFEKPSQTAGNWSSDNTVSRKEEKEENESEWTTSIF